MREQNPSPDTSPELGELAAIQRTLAELDRQARAARKRQRVLLRRLRRRGVGVTELAHETGLARQTIHRLLRQP